MLLTRSDRKTAKFASRWDYIVLQGVARQFQTRRDDWPRSIPGGGLLIRDEAGDLYLIRDPTNLDKSSRRRIAVLVD